ncbi:MOSC domain-containing protein [Longispora albida]|uniref:MOSC domain-containing protein n=1 Tax=Longispora albida TaxID=203523 RepID=UPI00036E6D18|nr:MOSC N-terminal beta barrel domain-containing protein [Longispora albida]
MIKSIFRYPVKSARPETLTEAALDAAGLPGDRRWACADAADGTIASAKLPRRWGGLLHVGVSTAGEDTLVQLSGQSHVAGEPGTDAALSQYLGRDVRLTRTVPEGARLHRLMPGDEGMVPEWMAGAAPGDELVTQIGGAKPGGRFVDFGAVHLVTTGALAALSGLAGAAVPAIRFRPNLVLDLPGDPEPGTELRVGEALLRVVYPTPRCAIPGASHPGAPADPGLLGLLARHYRRELAGLGRAACFGVYAEVAEPGRISTTID